MLVAPLPADDFLFSLDAAPSGVVCTDTLYAAGWCLATRGGELPRVSATVRVLGSPLGEGLAGEGAMRGLGALPGVTPQGAGAPEGADIIYEVAAVATPRPDLVEGGVAEAAAVRCGFMWQLAIAEPSIIELSFTVALRSAAPHGPASLDGAAEGEPRGAVAVDRVSDGIAPRVVTVWPARYLARPQSGSPELLPTHLRNELRAQLALAARAADFVVAVERPVDTVVSGSPLRLAGWCRQVAGQPIEGLRARVGAATFALDYPLPRDDVRLAAHGYAGAALSGFSGRVPVPPGRVDVSLEVEHMGRWIAVRHLSLTVGKGRFATRAVQKAWEGVSAQWAEAKGGVGERLRHVSHAAREHLADDWLPWLTSGLHTPAFGDFAQHEPRPVACERFPRPTRATAQRLPRVSIVTPSYNQAAYLPATLDSVLTQDGVRLEYVVMDGGSTDGSAELIAARAPRLAHWQSAPDGGQSAAVADGFTHTSGAPDDLMAYLNSDDTLMPGVLRFVAEYMARHPEVDAVYGHRVVIDEHGLETGRWHTPRHRDDMLLHVDLIPQETLFWRRGLYERVGGVDRSFRFALDWDLLVRFAQAGAVMRRLPYYMGCFRVHSSSKTVTQSDTVGAREVEHILRRTHGREVGRDEVLRRWHVGLVEAAATRWLMARGVRW